MGDRDRGELITKASVIAMVIPFVASFFPGAVAFVFGVDTDLSEIGRIVRKILMFGLVMTMWFGRRHFFKLE